MAAKAAETAAAYGSTAMVRRSRPFIVSTCSRREGRGVPERCHLQTGETTGKPPLRLKNPSFFFVLGINRQGFCSSEAKRKYPLRGTSNGPQEKESSRSLRDRSSTAILMALPPMDGRCPDGHCPPDARPGGRSAGLGLIDRARISATGSMTWRPCPDGQRAGVPPLSSINDHDRMAME